MLCRIFGSNETEAILLVHTENAFNLINRKALLHKSECLCPTIATFLYNCHVISARRFVIGGKELRLHEGAAQRSPTAKTTYTLSLISLLDHLQSIQRCAKHLALADDVTGAVRIEEIKISWDALLTEGPKYGYYLIVKQHYTLL